MEKERIGKKTALEALALVFVLAFAFAGLWFIAEYIKDTQGVKSPDETITVSLTITSNDEWTIEYLEIETKNNTVFKFLLESKERNNFTVSYTRWELYDAVFVNAINGTQNGEDDMWWQYYVNGEYGEIASDKKEIFNGDVVEWRFEEPGQ